MKPSASMAAVDYHRVAAQAHYLRSKMARDAIGRLWQRLTHGATAAAASR